MLEDLFGSASRVKIIKFFCTHEGEKLYVRELARRLDIKLNALSRELDNLHEIGLLNSTLENGKKYFAVDNSFPLLHELRAIIIKSIVLLERKLVRELRELTGLRLLVLTGIFVNQETETDVLLVGRVDRGRVQKLIKSLSESFHQEIRFTILSPQEYAYRIEVTDKFINSILSATPITIIDRFTQRHLP